MGGGSKYKIRTFDVFLKMLKFTHFLGGPNGPKICGRRTKTDFKDRAILDQKNLTGLAGGSGKVKIWPRIGLAYGFGALSP